MSEKLTAEERAEMAARVDRPRRGKHGDSARLLAELERVEGKRGSRAREVEQILAAAKAAGMKYSSELRDVLRIALAAPADAVELRTALGRVEGRAATYTDHYGFAKEIRDIARGALGL